MKTSRRALIALAATIALAAGASAPSKAADPKERYGMVVFLKGSEFFNWAYAGFQDEAATLGATTELQGPADWDASAEARAVDQLVAKGVKGVAVTAGDADTLTASIDAGMKAKVPVLTFDSDSPKSHRLLFVGTNKLQRRLPGGSRRRQAARRQGARRHLANPRPRLDQPPRRGLHRRFEEDGAGRTNRHRGERRRGSAKGGASQYGNAPVAS